MPPVGGEGGVETGKKHVCQDRVNVLYRVSQCPPAAGRYRVAQHHAANTVCKRTKSLDMLHATGLLHTMNLSCLSLRRSKTLQHPVPTLRPTQGAPLLSLVLYRPVEPVQHVRHAVEHLGGGLRGRVQRRHEQADEAVLLLRGDGVTGPVGRGACLQGRV